MLNYAAKIHLFFSIETKKNEKTIQNGLKMIIFAVGNYKIQE